MIHRRRLRSLLTAILTFSFASFLFLSSRSTISDVDNNDDVNNKSPVLPNEHTIKTHNSDPPDQTLQRINVPNTQNEAHKPNRHLQAWQDNSGHSQPISNVPNKNEVSLPPADKIINPHNFEFILNPKDLCNKLRKDVFLLAIVHSAPANVKRRMVIRQTWGSQIYYDKVRTVTVFTMGSTNDTKIQASVEMESELYGDIVQENFHDSYRNLTYKGIMWLRWTTTYCPQAMFVLKVDDDIFVNIFNLVSHISTVYKRNVARNKTVMCLVWTKMKVIRDTRSKWYVSKEDWSEDYFTTYCSGSAYILSRDLIRPMYYQSLVTKFFWVDDFYITGLLIHPLNASYVSLASLYVLKKEELRTRLVDGYAIFGHIPGSMNQRYALWNEVLEARGMPKTLSDAYHIT